MTCTTESQCWTCRIAGVHGCALSPAHLSLPLVQGEIPRVLYAPLRQVIHKPNPGAPSR